MDGAVIRTIAKTTADGQAAVQRELRRALTEALETSGMSERIAASRLLPRRAVPPVLTSTGEQRSGRERPDLRVHRFGGCPDLGRMADNRAVRPSHGRTIGQNPARASAHAASRSRRARPRRVRRAPAVAATRRPSRTMEGLVSEDRPRRQRGRHAADAR